MVHAPLSKMKATLIKKAALDKSPQQKGAVPGCFLDFEGYFRACKT